MAAGKPVIRRHQTPTHAGTQRVEIQVAAARAVAVFQLGLADAVAATHPDVQAIRQRAADIWMHAGDIQLVLAVGGDTRVVILKLAAGMRQQHPDQHAVLQALVDAKLAAVQVAVPVQPVIVVGQPAVVAAGVQRDAGHADALAGGGKRQAVNKVV